MKWDAYETLVNDFTTVKCCVLYIFRFLFMNECNIIGKNIYVLRTKLIKTCRKASYIFSKTSCVIVEI